jgi:hydrogenase-4 component J
MPEMVSFHALRRKFLDTQKDVPTPEAAKQVMYYSLAIGHHVGVIDCLVKVLECPREDYEAWLELLPQGEARRKMTGLLTFGEIHIDATHAGCLGKTLTEALPGMPEPYKALSEQLLGHLADIVREPALYLMVQLPRRMA